MIKYGFPRNAGRFAPKPAAVEAVPEMLIVAPDVVKAEMVATVAVAQPSAVISSEIDDDDDMHPVGEFDHLEDADDGDAFTHWQDDHDDADAVRKPLPTPARPLPTVMRVAPVAPAAAVLPVVEAEVEVVADADAVVHPAEAEQRAYRALVGDPDDAPELKGPLPPPDRPKPTVMHERPKPPQPRTGLMSARIGGKLPFPRS